MKNTLELQLRALRPPRVLKKDNAGEPDLIDVWAIHHADRPSRPFALAVKFGREIAAKGTAIGIGTLFTIRGRLDQTKNPKTGIYHTLRMGRRNRRVGPIQKETSGAFRD